MNKFMVVVTAAILSVSLPVIAAPKGGGTSSPAASAAEHISKLMGQQSFQAKILMTIVSAKPGKDIMPGPMEMMMYMSAGKSCVEIDFSKMAGATDKGSGMPDLGKMIMITRPDKKVIYNVMPSLSAYCEMPIPEGAATGAEAPKISRKVEGNEKVDKYDCEKVRSTVTSADGTSSEVLTWEAKELKGFPVKMETESPEGKVTMLFTNIKTQKPADEIFDPPAKATKYGSMPEMMMAGMMKQMQK